MSSHKTATVSVSGMRPVVLASSAVMGYTGELNENPVRKHRGQTCTTARALTSIIATVDQLRKFDITRRQPSRVSRRFSL